MSRLALPRKIRWLLRKLIKEEYLEELEGDLAEMYAITSARSNRLYTGAWLFLEIILLLKRPLLKPFFNSQNSNTIMLRSHFKIGLRSLRKFRGYTFLNIFGLTFGAASAIILFMITRHENSYDRFLPEHEQIYRLGEYTAETGEFYATRTPLAPALKENYPEVIAATRFHSFTGYWESGKKSSLTDVYIVDEDFSEIFRFETEEGDFHSALTEKGSIVLTVSKAFEFFGYERALGQTITKLPENSIYTVRAVVADPPANSSLQFEGLVSWKDKPDYLKPENAGNWYNTFMEIYVKLGKNVQPSQLTAKFPLLVKEKFLPQDDKAEIILLPITRLHEKVSDNQELISLLMLIALVKLLIAGFNFVNLNTAQLMQRIKEVSVRKVMGSSVNQIILQFVLESLMVIIIAMFTAILLAYLAVPFVKELFEIELGNIIFSDHLLLPVVFGGALIYGMVTSLLPAVFIARQPVIQSLKGAVKVNGSGGLVRKSLIILQFASSVFLVTGTVIIWKQINYMKDQDLKFNVEQTVYLWTYDANFRKDVSKKLLLLKEKLRKQSQVAGVAFTQGIPGRYNMNYNTFYDAKEPEKLIRLRQSTVDRDYFDALDIKLKYESRSLKDFTPVPGREYAVLNQAAMDAFGWESLTEQFISENLSTEKIEVLAVTEDFHYRGLNETIEPLIHWVRDSITNNALLVRLTNKVADRNGNQVFQLIRDEWEGLNAFEPAEIKWLDENFNQQYKSQEKLGYIATFFSAISIIIATLGLFSLATFVMRRQRKEIGIRKILGASVIQLFVLLSRKFVMLVLIAMLISIPLVIVLSDSFLQNFAYRINLHWSLFVVIVIVGMLIAMLSVGFQALQSSRSNPVNEIRDE